MPEGPKPSRGSSGIAAIFLGCAFLVFGYVLIILLVPGILQAASRNDWDTALFVYGLPSVLVVLPLLCASYFLVRGGICSLRGRA